MRNKLVLISVLLFATTATAEPPASVRDYIRSSQKALVDGNRGLAAEHAQSAINLDPASAEGWIQFGNVKYRSGNFATAAAAYRDALALAPEHTALWRELARSYQKSNEASKAITAMQKYLNADRRDPAAWRDLARWTSAAGDKREGIRLMQGALEQEPENASAWHDLGLWQWELDGIKSGREALEQGFALSGKDQESFKLKTIATIADKKQPDTAVALAKTWLTSYSGMDLVRKLREMKRRHAARQILEALWKSTPQDVELSIELAEARMQSGTRTGLPELLIKILSKGNETERMRARCIHLAARAWSVEGMVEVTTLLAKREKPQTDLGKVLTDSLENQAGMLRAREEYDRSLQLYIMVFTRDPERSSWYTFYSLILEQKGDEKAESLLNYLKESTPDGPIHEGIQGLLADHNKDRQNALKHYTKSIEGSPYQPALRQRLFRIQLEYGLNEAAGRNLEWFFKEVNMGRNELRSYLAEMLTRSGQSDRALTHWKLLNSVSPESSYYAVEAARILITQYKADQAMAVINDAMKYSKHARLYEMKAEILRIQGEPAKALELASEAMIHAPSTALHRLYAESAENAGFITASQPAICSNVLLSASAVMKAQPGYEPMVQLYGRTLEAMNLTNEAIAHYESILARNNSHLPALNALRHLVVRSGNMEYAETLSDILETLKPSDPQIRRQAAVLAGEQQKFRDGLKRLRTISDVSPDSVLTTLVYRHVSAHPYPGRVNVSQILAHVHHLNKAGFTFLTPEDLPSLTAESSRPVILLILNPDKEVFEKLDMALSEMKSVKLTCAVAPASLKPTPLGATLAQTIQQGVNAGRWYMMSSGPTDTSRKPCVPNGDLAGPFIHRRMFAGAEESIIEFSERIRSEVTHIVDSLGSTSTKSLYFPSGNYGQFALDIEPGILKIVEETVRDNLQFAFHSDPSGFFVPDPLAYMIPARTVQPGWGVKDLKKHLLERNPILRSRFDEAKLLYWSRQYELARPAFMKLANTQFEEADVRYNLAASAFREGDLPRAITGFRSALHHNPDHDRASSMIGEVEDQYQPLGSLRWLMWQDNEDRDYQTVGVGFNAYMNKTFRLGGRITREEWTRDDEETLEGNRLALPLHLYLNPGSWLSGEAWVMDLDEVDDITGGNLLYRHASPLLSGYYKLRYTQQEVDTIDAIKAGIDEEVFTADTYSRIRDEWDLFLTARFRDRSDGNTTRSISTIIDYRLKENPFFAPGYRGTIANSDRNPDEYWAPIDFQEHLAYATLRGTENNLYYATSLQAGVGKEGDEDWGFVWGARAATSLTLTTRTKLHLEGTFYQGPFYERFYLSAGLDCRF